MAKYLISFPSAAMVVPDDEWEAVDRDAHAVIDKAKAAGTATNWRNMPIQWRSKRRTAKPERRATPER